jgi:hypothetical protein
MTVWILAIGQQMSTRKRTKPFTIEPLDSTGNKSNYLKKDKAKPDESDIHISPLKQC